MPRPESCREHGVVRALAARGARRFARKEDGSPTKLEGAGPPVICRMNGSHTGNRKGMTRETGKIRWAGTRPVGREPYLKSRVRTEDCSFLAGTTTRPSFRRLALDCKTLPGPTTSSLDKKPLSGRDDNRHEETSEWKLVVGLSPSLSGLQPSPRLQSSQWSQSFSPDSELCLRQQSSSRARKIAWSATLS